MKNAYLPFFQESPVKESNVFITENSLIIRGVHEGNDGEYRCKAKNQIGQGVSEPQRVRVKGTYDSVFKVGQFYSNLKM